MIGAEELPPTPVSAAELTGWVAAILRGRDVPGADAALVAGLMVEADVQGYVTHGVFRLRQYLARLRDGGCNPRAEVRVLRETVATALVDGDNGLGHLAAARARDLAMAKARAVGIGWVGVRRGNHAGPLALYVREQALSGMVGMAAGVGSANHVPPYGGTDLLLGTNPIAIAAPSADPDPFLLDMATTVAAMGKVKSLALRGAMMPEGWMIGRDGRPLTDPARRSEGFMLPIGGPKGYGLSVAIGLLAGVLNGAAFGGSVVDFTADTVSETNTGQFILALDLRAFGAEDHFAEVAARAFAEMRASAPLPGHDAVRLPGDGRTALAEARRKEGLPLGAALIRDLAAIGAAEGIALPAPD